MPVPQNGFKRLIEANNKNLESFINPGNLDVNNSYLAFNAFNYLGIILEEKLKENPKLSIDNFPVLKSLIKNYSDGDMKLPYGL